MKFGQNDGASHQFQTFHIPLPIFLRATLDVCNFLSAFCVDWLKTNPHDDDARDVMTFQMPCKTSTHNRMHSINCRRNPLSILSALKGVENYKSNLVSTQEGKKHRFYPFIWAETRVKSSLSDLPKPNMKKIAPTIFKSLQLIMRHELRVSLLICIIPLSKVCCVPRCGFWVWRVKTIQTDIYPHTFRYRFYFMMKKSFRIKSLNEIDCHFSKITRMIPA